LYILASEKNKRKKENRRENRRKLVIGKPIFSKKRKGILRKDISNCSNGEFICYDKYAYI